VGLAFVHNYITIYYKIARTSNAKTQIQDTTGIQSDLNVHVRPDILLTFSRLENRITWYSKSSAVAEMGDHLATIDMDQKVWGCCAPFWGSWVPI